MSQSGAPVIGALAISSDKREKVDPNAEEWWQDSSLGDSELADMLGAHSWFHHGEPNPTALLMREAATRIRKLSAISATLPTGEALRQIAKDVPRLEGSIHGPRLRCWHCSHAWTLEESEHHGERCAYVIATKVLSSYVGEKK